MRKCEHKQTCVTNSRAFDHAHNGRLSYKARSYPVKFFRRRQCLECGEKFTTVEIEETVADSLAEKVLIIKKAIKDLSEDL